MSMMVSHDAEDLEVPTQEIQSPSRAKVCAPCGSPIAPSSDRGVCGECEGALTHIATTPVEDKQNSATSRVTTSQSRTNLFPEPTNRPLASQPPELHLSRSQEETSITPVATSVTAQLTQSPQASQSTSAFSPQRAIANNLPAAIAEEQEVADAGISIEKRIGPSIATSHVSNTVDPSNLASPVNSSSPKASSPASIGCALTQEPTNRDSNARVASHTPAATNTVAAASQSNSRRTLVANPYKKSSAPSRRQPRLPTGKEESEMQQGREGIVATSSKRTSPPINRRLPFVPQKSSASRDAVAAERNGEEKDSTTPAATSVTAQLTHSPKARQSTSAFPPVSSEKRHGPSSAALQGSSTVEPTNLAPSVNSSSPKASSQASSGRALTQERTNQDPDARVSSPVPAATSAVASASRTSSQRTLIRVVNPYKKSSAQSTRQPHPSAASEASSMQNAYRAMADRLYERIFATRTKRTSPPVSERLSRVPRKSSASRGAATTDNDSDEEDPVVAVGVHSPAMVLRERFAEAQSKGQVIDLLSAEKSSEGRLSTNSRPDAQKVVQMQQSVSTPQATRGSTTTDCQSESSPLEVATVKTLTDVLQDRLEQAEREGRIEEILQSSDDDEPPSKKQRSSPHRDEDDEDEDSEDCTADDEDDRDLCAGGCGSDDIVDSGMYCNDCCANKDLCVQCQESQREPGTNYCEECLYSLNCCIECDSPMDGLEPRLLCCACRAT